MDNAAARALLVPRARLVARAGRVAVLTLALAAVVTALAAYRLGPDAQACAFVARINRQLGDATSAHCGGYWSAGQLAVASLLAVAAVAVAWAERYVASQLAETEADRQAAKATHQAVMAKLAADMRDAEVRGEAERLAADQDAKAEAARQQAEAARQS